MGFRICAGKRSLGKSRTILRMPPDDRGHSSLVALCVSTVLLVTALVINNASAPDNAALLATHVGDVPRSAASQRLLHKQLASVCLSILPLPWPGIRAAPQSVAISFYSLRTLTHSYSTSKEPHGALVLATPRASEPAFESLLQVDANSPVLHRPTRRLWRSQPHARARLHLPTRALRQVFTWGARRHHLCCSSISATRTTKLI